jgi:hypothetical protein
VASISSDNVVFSFGESDDFAKSSARSLRTRGVSLGIQWFAIAMFFFLFS